MTTSDFTFAWEHAASPDGPWAHLSVVRFRGREELSALYRYDLVLLARAPGRRDRPARPHRRARHAPDRDAHRARLQARPRRHRRGRGARPRARGDALPRRAHAPARARAAPHPLPHLPGEDHAPDRQRRPPGRPQPHPRPERRRRGRPRPHVHASRPPPRSSAGASPTRSRIDDAARPRPTASSTTRATSPSSRACSRRRASATTSRTARASACSSSPTATTARRRLDPFDPLGPTVAARHVGALKLGARLREKTVRLGDYDWRKPALDLGAEAKGDRDDLFEYRWPGGYADGKTLGEPLAQARLDRYHVEAEYATVEGSVPHARRRLGLPRRAREGPLRGRVPRHQARRARRAARAWRRCRSTRASDVPFACSFECARRGRGAAVEASRFRPARATPRPRIVGSQTAFVTDEPVVEGRGDPRRRARRARRSAACGSASTGTREEARLAKEPSSCWVRVSQTFAGQGEGAMWHPRVGCEVIVDFLDGDPDRPIVTGRVYNGQNRPPGPASGAATVSLSSRSRAPAAR